MYLQPKFSLALWVETEERDFQLQLLRLFNTSLKNNICSPQVVGKAMLLKLKWNGKTSLLNILWQGEEVINVLMKGTFYNMLFTQSF